MKAVTSKIKLNVPKIKQLDRASTIALEDVYKRQSVDTKD